MHYLVQLNEFNLSITDEKNYTHDFSLSMTAIADMHSIKTKSGKDTAKYLIARFAAINNEVKKALSQSL